MTCEQGGVPPPTECGTPQWPWARRVSMGWVGRVSGEVDTDMGDEVGQPLAPAWFRAAVATPFDSAAVDVTGATVRSRCWGPPGPGVVLVHGGAAHAGWWDHIGPLLASQRRVVAIDLSGHGDSDRRTEYGLLPWAAEILAQARAGGISGRPYVVGHSMGGYVSLAAAAEFVDDLAGVIVIDSPVPAATPGPELCPERVSARPLHHYQSRAAALSRFRVVPPDPYVLPYVQAHIAAQSLRRDAEGWIWKFDQESLRRDRRFPVELLPRIRCPVVILRAEHGLITDDHVRRMTDGFGRRIPFVVLPGVGHHALLDDPLSLVVGLRTVLACWESDPIR
jgi:pimeloyl-ACP methyl ester carboxylesterase